MGPRAATATSCHEFLADAATGHNLVATVFIECHSMYRADGPAEMRPVGETEFVAGQAAMSASGMYGPTRVAAGIVGFADLTLGDRVEPVLEAHLRAGGGRFRGVRHSAAWDASDVIGNSEAADGPHLYRRADFRAGLAALTRSGSRSTPGCSIRSSPTWSTWRAPVPTPASSWATCGGPLGYGPYTGKQEEVFAAWKPHDRPSSRAAPTSS